MLSLTNASCLMPTSGAGPQLFAATLQYLAAAQCLLNYETFPDSQIRNYQTFDFIIIGAGTSGSVVAKRLSEVKGWKILLIDAGDEPPVESRIPGLDNTLYDSEFDWKYKVTPYGARNQALVDSAIKLHRGKMLGGSSSLNEMHYIRGHDQDFQKWYDAGNEDWSLEDVHRCFKKAESLQNKKLLKDHTIKNFYGDEGLLPVNRFNCTNRDITNGVLKAWNEIGFKYVPDLNTAGLIGSGIVTATASDGVRQNTYTGYLAPIKNNGNLYLLKNAVAKNILITKTTKLAFGVQLEKDNKTLTFYSTREVIVCAGAVNTPQLLMLSGIGPEDHLRSKNITCLVNSTMVGQNLQDHMFVPITVYADEPEDTSVKETHRDIVNYLLDRTGPLAESKVLTDITAFYATQKNIPYPEFQLYLSIIPKNSTNLKATLKSQYGYKDIILDSMVTFNKNYTLYFFGVSLLHPYSRGNITLNTNNHKDSPLISLKYFSNSMDLKTVIQGLKMASKITKSTYFKSMEGFLGRMNWQVCNNFELDSERFWECKCINMATSRSHLVGTCKMGTDPNTSVVDSRLKVHGVKRLRIVDASVMPEITSGNINGPSIMIAERASEFIKEEYDN